MIPTRLTGAHGGLLLIDIQEKLVRNIPQGPLVVANAVRLVQTAEALELPVWATEQYPKGLGPTVPELAGRLSHRPSKTAFSCCAVGELIERWHGLGIRHLTLAGVEAHVCVAQTALDLLDLGFRVQVPADAVASRQRFDWEFALRRLERAGAIISTTEAVLFEWVENAANPAFRTVSELVKSFTPPRPEGGGES
jgi:nicotinamidase-related amidase